MASPRQIIDPRSTLPLVEFEVRRFEEVAYTSREQISIMQRGERMGTCDLVYELRPHVKVAHFDGIEVRSAKRGRGIGMATYVLAIEQAHARGYDFETQDYELTEHSKKIWEKLAATGIAQVIRPFAPSPRREGKFIGKYRIPARNSR